VVLFVVLFLAADVLAVGAFLVVVPVELDDDAEVFLTGAFFAVDFVAAEDADVLAAGDFLAVDFFAVVLEAADLEAADFEAVVFDAADFEAVDLDAVDLDAVDFAVVVEVFLAGVFFAVLEEDVLEDGVVFAVDERVVGVARLAADFAVPAATTATARTEGGLGIVAAVSRGSFLAPETTFLRSWPGENFGTAFFFDFIRSPVCGLRTQRALRTAFSKEPNPVMATFSPLATSRVIVSSTESSACAACLRFPS
jgi:hypothetical protein